MTTPFDPERCPIPPITRIPVTPLLPDTTVPEPPGEIVDCLDPLTPLAPEPPCPVLTVGSAALNTGVSASATGIVLTVTKGNCCEYELSIDFNLPSILGGCPELAPSPVRTVAYTDPDVFPDGTARVAITALENCVFEFDPEIEVHCPELTTTTPVVAIEAGSVSTGRSRLIVTRGAGCDYNFDVELNLPCIPFTVAGEESATFPVTRSSGAGTLGITITPGPNCTYDFTFAPRLPCLALPASRPKVLTLTPYTSLSVGSLALSVVPGANCAFDFQGEMQTISPGAVAVLDEFGATARTNLTLGFGFVTLYRVNRFTGALTAVATHIKVYNYKLTAIPRDRFVALALIDGALAITEGSPQYLVTFGALACAATPMAGARIEASQGGVSVGSCVTGDGTNGTTLGFCDIAATNLGTYDLSITPPVGVLFVPTNFTVLSSGAARQLNAAPTYVCGCLCPSPFPQTMTFSDGLGTHTLTNLGGGGLGWAGTGVASGVQTYIGTGGLVSCTLDVVKDVTITYSLQLVSSICRWYFTMSWLMTNCFNGTDNEHHYSPGPGTVFTLPAAIYDMTVSSCNTGMLTFNLPTVSTPGVPGPGGLIGMPVPGGGGTITVLF